MDNQEFQNLVLKWMERVENHIERVENRIERVDDRIERVDDRIERVENRLGSLEQDVGWIKGKMEGRSESSSAYRANIAIAISIVVGIGSLLGLIITWVK